MNLLASWTAMLLILATWLLWTTALTAIGAAILRLVRIPPPHLSLWAFWIGLAAVIAFLQLWHLLLPIDQRPTYLILISGAILLIPHLKNLSSLTQRPSREFLTLLASSFLLTLWLANRSTGPETFYDSGLYHQQALLWAEQYPIIPGLANLHFRLGFSSGITLFAAMLDQTPPHTLWHGQVTHLVNGLFLAALAFMILQATTRILFHKSTRASDWLTLFFAMPLSDWALDVQSASLSTDLPAAIISMAAAIAFLNFYECRHDPRESSGRAFITITLASLAIACKGAALPFAGSLIAITLALRLKSPPPETPTQRRANLLAIAASFFLLIGLWIISNLITSGYPLFPAPAFPIPADWTVPLERVQQIRITTRDWNTWESFDPTTGHWRWLGPWLALRIFPVEFLFKALIPFLLAIVSATFFLFNFRHRAKLDAWPAAPWLILASCIAILIWFFNAPAPRLGSQNFQILAAATLLLPIGPLLANTYSNRIRNLLLTAATLLFLEPPLAYVFSHGSPQGPLATLWLPPPSPESPGGFYPRLFHPQIIPVQTNSGLILYIPYPKTGPGDYGDRVWDLAQLPSAPSSEFNPYLRLRDPNSLRHGFTLQPP